MQSTSAGDRASVEPTNAASQDVSTNANGSASTGSLREELHRLYSLRPSLDTFADEAIRLLVSESGVTAAAIFTYSTRKNQLNLLTMTGLDEESMTAIRASIGRTWDIPLRSIRNRRINVIDSAHENPFVPDAIKAISPQSLTIASIPFYHSSTPVGVAVLFSATMEPFSDNVLRSVSQGLRVCGAAITELPKTSSAVAPHFEESTGTEQPNLLRGLAALKAELVRLTSALEESERQRAAEVAERVTAQSFLKAAQQRSERAEHELNELREKQKRIPQLEHEGIELERRLKNATELAEKAKNRVAQLEADLEDKAHDNEIKAAELAELRTKREELERDLKRAGELAERHEQSANELNEQVGRLDAIKEEAERLRIDLEQTRTARTEAEDKAATLEAALAEAEAAQKALDEELNESKSALVTTTKERESIYSDALKSWEKLEEIEEQKISLARERENLHATNESNQQRIQELESVRTALEGERRDQTAALEQLNGQVETLEAQRTQLHEELERIRSESGSTLSDLRDQLEQADRDRTSLSEQVAALKRLEEERERLISRVEELEGDVGIARQSNQRIEGELANFKKEAERLDIEKSALEMRIEVLAENEQTIAREKGEEVSQARAEAQTLTQKLTEREQQLQAREQEFEQKVAETRAEAQAALEEVEKDLETVNEQRQQLEAEVQRAREDESVRDELLTTAEQEHKTLEQRVEALSEERNGLTTDLERARTDLEASNARTKETETRIAELEGSLRSLRDGDLVDLRTKFDSTDKARGEAEEALAEAQERHALEVIDLQDRLALAQQERDQLTRSLDEKDQLLQSAEHGLTTLDIEDDIGDDDLALEIDRSGPTTAESEFSDDNREGEAPDTVPTASEQIILLDLENMIGSVAQHLSSIGHQITALEPVPESALELADSAFACAAINLAAPSAWPTLRKMRNGAGVPHTPMIAYALGDKAEKGFWLGPVDFATMPIADRDLRKILSAMVPNLRRVLAMSHDFDLMEEVQEQLSVGRISTAVVLDGRQALDLVPTIKPQAAVLHMSPNCTDVFRAVAGLRTQEETRNIPILFILDEEAQPREESFVTAGIRMLSGRGSLNPESLPSSLASALDSFQTQA